MRKGVYDHDQPDPRCQVTHRKDAMRHYAVAELDVVDPG
jgi:hypothetical protein